MTDPAFSDPGTVTRCIADPKASQTTAAIDLVRRYFDRLAAQARSRMAGPRRDAMLLDEEDIALTVLHRVCDGLRGGRYPDLDDRDGLWRLLLHAIGQRILDEQRKQGRAKRTGGRSRLVASDDGPDPVDLLLSAEPSPADFAELAEQCRLRLDQLRDPMLRKIAELKLSGHTNPEVAAELGRSLRGVTLKLALIRQIWSDED